MAAAFERIALDGLDGARHVDLGERLGRLALHVDVRGATCESAVVDGLHACGDACHHAVIEHGATGERLGGDGFEHVVVLRPLHRLQLFAVAEHALAKRLQAAGQHDGLQLRTGERAPAQASDAGVGGERDRGQVRRSAAADDGDEAAVDGCRDLERDRTGVDVVHGQLVRFLVQRQPDLRGRCRAGNVADVAVHLVAGDALGGCQQVFAVVLVVDVRGLGAVVVGRRARVVGVGVGIGVGVGVGIGVGCGVAGSCGVDCGCGVAGVLGGGADGVAGARDIAGSRRRCARGSLRILRVLGALRALSALRVGGPFAACHDLRTYDEHPAIGGVGSSVARIGDAGANRVTSRITVSHIGVARITVSRTGSVRPQALSRCGDGFRALRKTCHGHQTRRQNARQRHRRPAIPSRPPQTHARTRRTHTLSALSRARIGTHTPLRHIRPMPTGPATPFRSHSSLLPVSAPGSDDRPRRSAHKLPIHPASSPKPAKTTRFAYTYHPLTRGNASAKIPAPNPDTSGT